MAEGSRTRGHRFKLIGKRTKGDMRKIVFTHRVVRIWNELPERVVEADSIVAFKRELAKYLKETNLQSYRRGTS